VHVPPLRTKSHKRPEEQQRHQRRTSILGRSSDSMTIQAIRQITAKTAAKNRNSRATPSPRECLAALPLEERQALLVELGDAFIDRRVRTALENRKLA